jgi:DNA-binding NarL/FixJ family response regulator
LRLKHVGGSRTKGGKDMNNYGRKVLLVVSDLPDLLGATELNFRKAGYQATLEFSVRDAMERLRGSFFDLVIIDLTRVFEEGIDCLQKIQDIQPASLIMVLTGNAASELNLSPEAAMPNYFLVSSESTDKRLWFPCYEESPNFVN